MCKTKFQIAQELTMSTNATHVAVSLENNQAESCILDTNRDQFSTIPIDDQITYLKNKWVFFSREELHPAIVLPIDKARKLDMPKWATHVAVNGENPDEVHPCVADEISEGYFTSNGIDHISDGDIQFISDEDAYDWSIFSREELHNEIFNFNEVAMNTEMEPWATHIAVHRTKHYTTNCEFNATTHKLHSHSPLHGTTNPTYPSLSPDEWIFYTREELGKNSPDSNIERMEKALKAVIPDWATHVAISEDNATTEVCMWNEDDSNYYLFDINEDYTFNPKFDESLWGFYSKEYLNRLKNFHSVEEQS